MTTAYSTNLGLALPVQGELSGTWGDTVNNGITQYSDIAIAGTLTLNGDGAVTLSNTNGNASGTNIGSTTAQYAILKITGTLTTTKVITAPASSKIYLVDNAATGGSVTIKASGQTGYTVAVGTKAYVYFNGTDYVLASTNDIAKLTGTLGIANGGTGQTTASAAFNALSPVTTTGDLIIGNGSNSATRLAIGSNGTVLTSNGTTASWAAVTAGDVTAAGNNAFTGANTFYNATGQTFGTATTAQDGIKITGRAGGTSTYRITLTPATLSSSTTLTLPNVTDTVATVGAAQTFTAAQTFRAANAIRSEAASTQDAIVLAGRAGGTSSYAVTLTPATLASNTTLTLPNVTDTVTAIAATQTLTNKRVTPRVSTTTSSGTPTINTDNVDMFGLTALAVNITSFTTNLSGTPTDGQKLWIYIVGTATRTITWGDSFEASTIALPTTTVSTARLDVGFVWNAATSKWRCVAVA